MIASKRCLLISSFLLALLVPAALSIGLTYTPLGGPVIFEPNKRLVRDITITNFMYDAELSSEGELAEYLTFVKGEKTPTAVPFQAILQLPAELPPGFHELYIQVLDVVAPTAGGVGGRTAVRLAMPVLVLSPEKTIQASLGTPNMNEGETTVFTVSVQSYTTQHIKDVGATIEVYDEEGAFLRQVKTNHVSLESYEKVPLVAAFDASGLKRGAYTAKAVVAYDGNTMDLDSSFRIGSLNIEILEIPTTLNKDIIAPFSILIESGWNLPLKGVWAEVEVAGKTAKTPTLDLDPWQQTRIKGFIELGEVAEEEDITVKVLYEDEAGELHTFSKKGIVRFVEPREGEKSLAAEEETPGKTGLMRIGIVLGIVLIVALLLLNAFWMYRSMKKGPSKER